MCRNCEMCSYCPKKCDEAPKVKFSPLRTFIGISAIVIMACVLSAFT